MILVKSFLMCLGMFTIIPVPKNSWNDKYMHLITPNMVIAGALIGTIWYAASTALFYLPVFSTALYTAVAALVPFVLSGFLHIDGYMDTADAVFSRRNLDEKRRILKDSHVGAFAAIALVCLVLFQFCAMYTVLTEYKEIYSLIFIPVMSRGVAGIALLELKTISKEGFGASFKANTKRVHTVFILLFMAFCLLASCVFFGISTVMPLVITIVSAICVLKYVYTQLDGISGDLCGCIITVSELAGLITLAMLR